jgi:hypothetical protein
MEYSRSKLKRSAFISTILLLPFVMPELVNRWNFNEGSPLPLLLTLWLLPVVLVFLLVPVVVNVRAVKRILAGPIVPAIRGAIRMIPASLWLGILPDRTP